MPLSPGLQRTLQVDWARGQWSAASLAYLEQVMVALGPASPLWTPGVARTVARDWQRGVWSPTTRQFVTALAGGTLSASQAQALGRDLASGQWGSLTRAFFASLP